MKITIKRFNEQESFEEYEVLEKKTLLENLQEIKENSDSTLTFKYGCRSGVCGCCAVRVNGQERLSCKTKVNENALIEPLKNYKVLKDLVVDLSKEEELIRVSQAFLHEYSKEIISSKDEKQIDTQSNCILCQSCYSSCPVFETNENFLGPYALTRALRYVDDKKEQSSIDILTSVQNSGIWDCTLCGNCTFVCPQGIDPKMDITKLRMKSVQKGFEDKSMQNFNSFNSGFDPLGGFNPNGF
ncbi:succinate dehydrogenase/fumarate reductase iron-sulfur subunit [Halarcobacter bivalviorum]|uniref:succinate dehydrogenase/fumarate reductase iron-sulfur subunit n=1 Tax=Halarcobacter bivalviorum TaxID=663364 RepID=UPI00100A4B2A|nr:2Fe-2S iron-sulfur cluster-binding protein [Halarcobacter bivalviorum]RXK06549.1 succinate dehydrogenase [Halarcobacter bivalviorum]